MYLWTSATYSYTENGGEICITTQYEGYELFLEFTVQPYWFVHLLCDPHNFYYLRMPASTA